MTTGTAAPTAPTFAGKPAQQEMAAKAFEMMRRQGMFYADDAPVIVSLDRLVQGLSRAYPKLTPDKLKTQLQAALDSNPEVFTRQESGGALSYETTRSGHQRVVIDETRHMFRLRLNTEARDVTEEESRELTEGWISQAQERAESFTIFQEPAAEAAVAARWQGIGDIASMVAPAQPVEEEEAPPADEVVFPGTAWLKAPAAAPPSEEAEQPAAEAPATPLAEAPSSPPEAEITPPSAPEVEPPPAPAPPPPVRAVPAPPPLPRGPARFVFPTSGGEATIDVTEPLDQILAEYGPDLEAMMSKALSEDFRFASFGDEWYVEDHVERFSKGDFRRIREYLIETQEALSDRTFLSDVLNRRENDPDYERLRFSLDYRLLREKKDFEFVGVPNDRLWIVAGASPVSVPKRKPSELGQDYRYLEDTAAQALEQGLEEPPTAWEHSLTYYEYENGLLPYDMTARALMPPPMLEDQRATVLRIELPALFQSFPVELRYPTGNRGGYLVGFDAFFQESLVPGATFVIEPTDQQNVFTLRFEQTTAQEDSLLQYDERRSRFVYRPTTFYAGASPEWLLNEARFPKLDGLKRLDDAERRKPENIVVRAFEMVGEESEGRILAPLSDLLPVVNLERPFSVGALRAVLEAANHRYFATDPDTTGLYYYDPSKR